MSWNPDTKRYESGGWGDVRESRNPKTAHLPVGFVHVSKGKPAETAFDRIGTSKDFSQLVRAREQLSQNPGKVADAGERERVRMALDSRIEQLRPAAQGLTPQGRPALRFPNLRDRLEGRRAEEAAAAPAKNDAERLASEGGTA